MIICWGSQMNENRTKEKIIDKIMKKINDRIMLHPIRMTVAISAILFVIAFAFRWVLWRVDCWFQGRTDGWLFFVQADQGIETWFSFFGSYFGVMATVALGIITLRLSFKISHKEQIAKLQGLRIKEIYLYNMFADFAPSQLLHSDVRNIQFLLKIVLLGHDPGYELDVTDIRWADCGEDYKEQNERKLSDCKVYVDKADDPIIYIYFNEFNSKDCPIDSKETISYFYHTNRYEPLLMERYNRCRWLRITMTMKERIWKKGQMPEQLSADFRILFENGDKRKDCVELYEVKHNMEIEDK